MATLINTTNIPPPRVPIIDERTGAMSREWYRFFLSLFELGGGGSNPVSLSDLQKGPRPASIGELDAIINKTSEDVSPSDSDASALIAQALQALEQNEPPVGLAEVYKQLQALEQNEPPVGLAEVYKQLQSLELAPANGVELVVDYVNGLTKAPAVKTADFTVAAGETWIINNKAGATCTATLPSPAADVGRELRFQNYQDQNLESASSNVVPLAGGAASTSILLDVAGAHATLVSDGTNWVMTQYGPNNSLLLE